ncbi:hypothetical protein JJE66_16145 [Bradyrhizobium diazoefficiens]|nr:hypothetical protein [Bradyrhizobium diazoefficiens]MBK3662763.1 hypothetical protein [Bradyrhizobium diazoefficiens]
MTTKTRRKIDAALKAKIALKAVRGQAPRAFDAGVGRGERGREIEKLHAKIGQLTVDCVFLAQMSVR